jgi:hypothetical protein
MDCNDWFSHNNRTFDPSVRWVFDIVSGRVFSAKGNAGAGHPEFALLHVGEEVSVSYLTDDPYVSCLGGPDDLLRNETISVSLATIIFPAFAIAAFAARYSAFRRWLTN